MSMKVVAGVVKRKPLRIMSRSGFIYFIMLLVYGHAVAYRLLEYYVPRSGELLTLSYTLLLIAAFYAVLLRILVRKKLGGLPFIFLLLYMMAGILSVVSMYLNFGTVDFAQFAIGFYRSMLPITLVFLTYFSVQNIAQGARLFNSIAWINTLVAMMGLITYLLGERWVEYYLQLPQIEKLPLHFGGVLRMTSVLWNPLVFGILMALNSIMAWNIILHHRKVRFLWFVMFAISVVATVASFTRTAWLILLFGAMASSLVALRRISRRFVAILAVSVVTIVAVLNIPLSLGNYNSMAEAILGHVEATFAHESPRIEDFRVNMQRIAICPIGYGLGTAGYAALPTRGLNSSVIFTEFVAADNNYLSIALQVGIPALVLFILAHITALSSIVQKCKKTKDDRERTVLGTAVGWIVGMAVGAVFLNIWEYNLVPYVAYALIGTALKLAALPPGREQNARLG